MREVEVTMHGKILRLARSMMLLASIVILLVTAPLSAKGEYYSEDFQSSSSLDDWLLYNVNTAGTPNWDSHSWEIINGSLTSMGEKSLTGFPLNVACHKTGFDNGIWSYDYYGPTDEEFRISFRIAKFPPINKTTSEPLIKTPSFIQTIIEVGMNAAGNRIGNDSRILINKIYNDGKYVSPYSSIGVYNASLEDAQVRGWHHIQIDKNETNINVFLNGKYINGGLINETRDVVYDSVCVWMDQGTGAAIDNITVQTPLLDIITTRGVFYDLDFIQIVLLSSAIIMSIFVLFYSGRLYLKKKQLSKTLELHKINLDKIKSVNPEFDLTDKSLYTLFCGTINSNNGYSDERFKEFIPQEILTYRYLMHPLRLTIMKLLNSVDSMRSIDIKTALNISWNEYSNHMKSLEQKGYLEVQNEFNDDGTLIQVGYITEFGRKQFQLLFGLLQQFVTKTTPYDYLLFTQDNLRDKELYPDNNKLK